MQEDRSIPQAARRSDRLQKEDCVRKAPTCHVRLIYATSLTVRSLLLIFAIHYWPLMSLCLCSASYRPQQSTHHLNSILATSHMPRHINPPTISFTLPPSPLPCPGSQGRRHSSRRTLTCSTPSLSSSQGPPQPFHQYHHYRVSDFEVSFGRDKVRSRKR